MNICLVCYEFPPTSGGEGTYTFNLAKGLSESGHSVVLMLPDHVVRKASSLKIGKIALRPVRNAEKPLMRVSSFMSRALADLPNVISAFNIDVVHFTFDYPPFPVRIDGLKAPIVSTLHHLHIVEALNMIHSGGNPIGLVPRVLRQMILSSSESSLLRQSDQVIAVSRYTGESAIRYSGIDRSKLSVVPNGIDSSALHAPEKVGINRFIERFGCSDKALVLYVGRLDKSKGLEFLVRAFQTVAREVPLARLAIVGGGDPSYLSSLIREADKRGLAEKIIFTGRIDQRLLMDAYRASSLVVLPSLMEGFGLTLLEAMSFGKPVVASRVGGIPEVVDHQRTGLLVRPGDPKGLAMAILSTLNNPSLSKEMGENGKGVVNSRFTVEKMSLLTQSVYEKVA